MASAAVTAVLLLAGGREDLRQAGPLATLPFAFIILAMCRGLCQAPLGDAPESDPGSTMAQGAFPSTGAPVG